MKKMRNIKLMALAAIAAGALAAPAAGSAAAGQAVTVTAAGIKVKACKEKDVVPLLMFVRGVHCHTALDLANEASSADEPCPLEWHDRRVRLRATIEGKKTAGPSVFLCTQKAGKRAFTYRPVTG